MMSSTTNTNEEATIPSPPSIPTPTETSDNKENTVQEPPLKRMKVDSPQMPHYNSHNIYSRPPAPPSNIAIPSLPPIVPPVTPLDDTVDSNHNHIKFVDDHGATIAPLPQPTEQWPLCAFCAKGGDLSRCSSCRQAYYCNRQCQVGHWEVHCIICQPGPPQPPNLPLGGQPVAPPTSLPHYTPTQQPQYSSQSPQHHHHRNGGYSESNGRSVRSSRRRSYDENGVSKEQYYCEECDRYFKNGQALGGHRSRVHSTRRNGSVDSHGMPTPRKRRRPSRARHAPTGSGQYVCPHCAREFATGNALGGHISGAHTKKSRRNAQLAAQRERERQQQNHQGPYDYPGGRYARPRHPNI